MTHASMLCCCHFMLDVRWLQCTKETTIYISVFIQLKHSEEHNNYHRNINHIIHKREPTTYNIRQPIFGPFHVLPQIQWFKFYRKFNTAHLGTAGIAVECLLVSRTQDGRLIEDYVEEFLELSCMVP